MERSDDDLRDSIAFHFVRAWIVTCPTEAKDRDPDTANELLEQWAVASGRAAEQPTDYER